MTRSSICISPTASTLLAVVLAIGAPAGPLAATAGAVTIPFGVPSRPHLSELGMTGRSIWSTPLASAI